MGNAHIDANPAAVDATRPPGWFDVAEVVGDRTLAEIADLREELERLFRLAFAAGDRWRAARAAVDRCIDATVAQGGRSASGYDAAFAGWTRQASGLGRLSDLGALIAHQLDGSLDGPDDLDLREQSDVRAVLGGDVA
jgi:hypothetical protein